MDALVLERFCRGPNATFGELFTDEERLFTVERPWLGNQPNVSCIPTGVYTVKPWESPKFGRCLIVTGNGVTEHADGFSRWGILLHPANLARELQGCIAPGTALGTLASEWAVLNSRHAMDTLLEQVDRELPFYIRNKEVA